LGDILELAIKSGEESSRNNKKYSSLAGGITLPVYLDGIPGAVAIFAAVTVEGKWIKES
jgi:hypothetical protein